MTSKDAHELPPDIEAALMEGAQIEHDFYRVMPEERPMTSKRWIAEGATVLEEGGEVGNIICQCGDWTAGADWSEPGFAHRMAQLIADEHNELQVARAVIEAVRGARQTRLWQYLATDGNGLLGLDKELERYKAALAAKGEHDG